MAFGVPSKRKLWSMESMKEALDFVECGGGLREAVRTYNVPVETLRLVLFPLIVDLAQTLY